MYNRDVLLSIFIIFDQSMQIPSAAVSLRTRSGIHRDENVTEKMKIYVRTLQLLMCHIGQDDNLKGGFCNIELVFFRIFFPPNLFSSEWLIVKFSNLIDTK